jgi:hypothetical protein
MMQEKCPLPVQNEYVWTAASSTESVRIRCMEFGRKERHSNFNGHMKEGNWITLIKKYTEVGYILNVMWV